MKQSNNNFIFCGVRVNGITVSYICVLGGNRKFVPDDLELVNTLAEVISLKLQKDNLFISKSGLEEEYYLTDLLMHPLVKKFIKEDKPNMELLKTLMVYLEIKIAQENLRFSWVLLWRLRISLKIH